MHLRGFTKRQYFIVWRLTESPTEVLADFPTESAKSARHYVILIFVTLGGRMVDIVKFINWGCLLTEGGGYLHRPPESELEPSPRESDQPDSARSGGRFTVLQVAPEWSWAERPSI